ncbi:MAG: nucleotidyltransferase family protein [Clostridia bacterium]|nr:nucleotidyltransferase family protein [Clostridia bacterium]
MAIIGIIAEFNPLHAGHKRLSDSVKQPDNTIICALSGNFVQRGDVSILSKQKRAEQALKCGVDIVSEIPVLWSMSTAQNFALAGVWQLYNLNCEKIVFGSECGDIQKLLTAADILLSDDFSSLVCESIKSGITFAAARQQAAEALGIDSTLLSSPNDNLGIEYIIAAKKLNLPMKFDCIKRMGASHDSNCADTSFVSSSFLRQKILDGNIGYAERFMPILLRGMINEENTADIARIEKAILGILRLKSQDELKNLPDISEGIENKLYFSIRVASSLEELSSMIKTKRYTLARVRRLILSAALGFDNEFFMTTPPYTRLLGFSKHGESVLKNIASITPVVTKASQIKQLENEAANKVFAAESRATDLYNLSFKTPRECGEEFKAKLLKY